MPRKLCSTAPHQVDIFTYNDRELKDNEVLIETKYASGKHGTTTAMFDNINFKGFDFDQEMRLFIDNNNFQEKKQENKIRTIGTTGVGIVKEVGKDVKKWVPGDKVFGLMKVSETNICQEDQLWKLNGIDPFAALCIEPAYVSFHCIRESNVRYGDTVAVIGLGAIGLITVNMAYRTGAKNVIAVDPLENRRKYVEKYGADVVLDPEQCDPGLKIHELTKGQGVDVAIEVSGSYKGLRSALRSVCVCGTVCSAGFYQGEAKDIWLGQEWHHNRLNMVVPHGCGWGHPPRDYPRWDEKRAYDTIVSLIRKDYLQLDGLINPLVTLDEMPKVFKKIEEYPAEVIKYGVKF